MLLTIVLLIIFEGLPFVLGMYVMDDVWRGRLKKKGINNYLKEEKEKEIIRQRTVLK